MRGLLLCCLALAAFGCKSSEPESDVIKAPDLPTPEETAGGGSGVGTGVRKVGEIKKN
jgi:hypothetical protein